MTRRAVIVPYCGMEESDCESSLCVPMISDGANYEVERKKQETQDYTRLGRCLCTYSRYWKQNKEIT